MSSAVLAHTHTADGCSAEAALRCSTRPLSAPPVAFCAGMGRRPTPATQAATVALPEKHPWAVRRAACVRVTRTPAALVTRCAPRATTGRRPMPARAGASPAPKANRVWAAWRAPAARSIPLRPDFKMTCASRARTGGPQTPTRPTGCAPRAPNARLGGTSMLATPRAASAPARAFLLPACTESRRARRALPEKSPRSGSRRVKSASRAPTLKVAAKGTVVHAGRARKGTQRPTAWTSVNSVLGVRHQTMPVARVCRAPLARTEAPHRESAPSARWVSSMPTLRRRALIAPWGGCPAQRRPASPALSANEKTGTGSAACHAISERSASAEQMPVRIVKAARSQTRHRVHASPVQLENSRLRAP